MEKETYFLSIVVRDKSGKIIKDAEGVGRTDLSFEVDIVPAHVESYLKSFGNTLSAWMPEHKITIDVSLFSTISRTYMCMNTYHVNSNRFIIH